VATVIGIPDSIIYSHHRPDWLARGRCHHRRSTQKRDRCDGNTTVPSAARRKGTHRAKVIFGVTRM